MKTITLSDQAIQQLSDLCRLVERRNPKNEISINMAKGICQYMNDHQVVTEAQAKWLARNADFYRITRPPELADLEIATPNGASSPTFQDQITQSLKRMESMLRDLHQARPRERREWQND